MAFCLGNDKENLFATISAHRINERARIITRGDDPRSEEKFLMAGAIRVVYINNLGGRQMAAELVRPQITSFLSLLFGHPERDHDIDKITVPADSPLVGMRLGEIDLRRHTNALVIAIVNPRARPSSALGRKRSSSRNPNLLCSRAIRSFRCSINSLETAAGLRDWRA